MRPDKKALHLNMSIKYTSQIPAHEPHRYTALHDWKYRITNMDLRFANEKARRAVIGYEHTQFDVFDTTPRLSAVSSRESVDTASILTD